MRSLPFILLIFLLAACTTTSTKEPNQKESATDIPTQAAAPSLLPDLGEAPELNNEVWLNTPEPLRLANLRGQVVLLDMWTFG